MKCKRCGNEISENAAFCQYCGAKLEECRDDIVYLNGIAGRIIENNEEPIRVQPKVRQAVRKPAEDEGPFIKAVITGVLAIISGILMFIGFFCSWDFDPLAGCLIANLICFFIFRKAYKTARIYCESKKSELILINVLAIISSLMSFFLLLLLFFATGGPSYKKDDDDDYDDDYIFGGY